MKAIWYLKGHGLNIYVYRDASEVGEQITSLFLNGLGDTFFPLKVKIILLLSPTDVNL